MQVPRRLHTPAARWACTAAAAVMACAWMVSQVFEWYYATGPNTRITLVDGRMCYSDESGDWNAPKHSRGWHFNLTLYPQGTYRDLTQNIWRNGFDGFRFIIIPLCYPLLITALPAAWLWRAHLRDQRIARAGACPNCGYDRRGLTSDAVCPECGVEPIPAKP